MISLASSSVRSARADVERHRDVADPLVLAERARALAAQRADRARSRGAPSSSELDGRLDRLLVLSRGRACRAASPSPPGWCRSPASAGCPGAGPGPGSSRCPGSVRLLLVCLPTRVRDRRRTRPPARARPTSDPVAMAHAEAPPARKGARAHWLQPVGDQARRSPRPASSCRKCQASSILRGAAAPISSANALADLERQHRVGVGPEHQRRPLVARAARRATRLPSAAPGVVGLGRQDQREGAGAGLRLRASGTARRRRRSPRRPGRACSAPRTSIADRQVLGALDEVAEREPGVAHRLVAGEQAGVHDHDAARSGRGARPRSRRPIGPPQSWTTTVASRRSRSSSSVARRARRGGRRCTSRGRSACRSGRSRRSRARCSGSRRRAPAGSPCATGTTRSARRGRRRPARPRPRRGGRAAARRPRGSAARTGSPGRPSKRSSGVRKTSPTRPRSYATGASPAPGNSRSSLRDVGRQTNRVVVELAPCDPARLANRRRSARGRERGRARRPRSSRGTRVRRARRSSSAARHAKSHSIQTVTDSYVRVYLWSG